MTMGLVRLLSPWPEARVVCDDEQLIVVDKLAGIPVHGGAAQGGDDLVARIMARDLLLGSSRYLGVHQRLDKDVSGLMFLNRNPADNKQLANDAALHRTRRHYLAVVASRAGAG